MWYSPTITLICGQAQVKCINHVKHTCMYLSAQTYTLISTPSEQNSHFTNLTWSDMCMLACQVFNGILEAVCLGFWRNYQHALLSWLCYVFQQDPFFYCQNESAARCSLTDKPVKLFFLSQLNVQSWNYSKLTQVVCLQCHSTFEQ